MPANGGSQAPGNSPWPQGTPPQAPRNPAQAPSGSKLSWIWNGGTQYRHRGAVSLGGPGEAMANVSAPGPKAPRAC